MTSQMDRAMGALAGVALGDALGMPAQTLQRPDIVSAYGRISDFVAPYSGHPVSHGLTSAQVTDDTEQTLLLAKLLIANPDGFDDHLWAQTLLEWEADVRARGLLDLLGPSSKSALEALAAGTSVKETGKNGTTNGAAMRIAPVGVMMPADDTAGLVEKVVEACQVTHSSREAIAAASAVAMTISQGLDGSSLEAALPKALEACKLGSSKGHPVGEAHMDARITDAIEAAATGGEEALLKTAGNSVASRESVAAAFGIAWLAKDDPWQVALLAANFGDDTDTIGAIACSMVGACTGLAAFPADKINRVLEVNHLDLEPIAGSLLHIRNEKSDRRRTAP
ncbi:ADP-ribosylglycohydrolase family protein [Roseibium sp. SCPC15]|uniref:ADP-ribosylglycohydrolase family protein n=1 Tax=Roseibium sp. SCP15 TaxID=3141376 RepID=UPI00333BF889